MYKKSIVYLLLITVIVCPLSSCKSKDGNMVETSPIDRPLTELDDRIYTDEELDSIINYSAPLKELIAEFSAKCIRLDSNSMYRISFRGVDHVAVMQYDKEGRFVSGTKHKLSVSKNELDIQIGKSLESVMAKDPDGEYLFLYTGRNNQRYSSHYTMDGYLIIIEWSNENTVETIHIECL